MGCTPGDDECNSDEKPQHLVVIKAFYMDKTKVTLEAYRKCVEVGRCSTPDSMHHCNWWITGGNNYPVNCVTWKQAKSYCEWDGKRLPSESEWEYVARSGHSNCKYSWGNDLDHFNAIDAEWETRDQSKGLEAPVATYSANEYGLFDLPNNGSEWLEDCRNCNYNGAPTDGQAWIQGDCVQRALRGAFWAKGIARTRRVAIRCWDYANNRSGINMYSFRCAKSVE